MWTAGDYGFDQGVDQAVDIPRSGGSTQRYTVKGLLIYKRQANGKFLVYRDIWNNNSASRP
jgi:ketosteroid isomerase-like protein